MVRLQLDLNNDDARHFAATMRRLKDQLGQIMAGEQPGDRHAAGRSWLVASRVHADLNASLLKKAAELNGERP